MVQSHYPHAEGFVKKSPDSCRRELLGEMIHAHCAYSHDYRDYFYCDNNGAERWQLEYFKKYNRNFFTRPMRWGRF